MPGNFAEFGPESSGPGLALNEQSKWALQAQEALASAAHARYFNAHAGQLETEASQNAVLTAAAPGAFTGGGTTPGQPTSQATPFYRLAQIAGSLGMVKKAEELAKGGAGIAFKEQEIATSQASQALHKVQTVKAQQEQNVEKAGELLSISTQEVYDNWRMTRSQAGEDVSDLPPDLATAQRMVQPLYAGSIKAVDAAKATEKKLVDAANIKRLNAQAGASGAAAGASAARADVSRQTYNFRAKNDGDSSTAVRDLRLARTADVKSATAARGVAIDTRDAAAAARDLVKYPAAPADPSKRTVGTTYTWPDKSKVLWTINPTTGKPGAQLVSPPPKVRAPLAASTVDTSGEEDDNTGDE